MGGAAGHGACQEVTDGGVSDTLSTINMNLIVCVVPVGIDPCFYFPISHLWLVRVVWCSSSCLAHVCLHSGGFTHNFKVVVELREAHLRTSYIMFKHTVLLLLQPTAMGLCLSVIQALVHCCCSKLKTGINCRWMDGWMDR